MCYNIVMKVGEDFKAGRRRDEIGRVSQLPGPAPAAVPPERLAASDPGPGSVTPQPGRNLRRGVFSQFFVLVVGQSRALARRMFAQDAIYPATSSRPASFPRRHLNQ